MPISNANTDQATGWCLEVHDPALSKLFAGREKDLKFIRGLSKHGFIREGILRERIEEIPVTDEEKSLALRRLPGLLEGEA